MARKLTAKRRGFVKTYVQKGIASIAVKENYNVTDNKIAAVIGSQLLGDPKIQEAIAKYGDGLPDKLLLDKHLALLNKMEVKRTFDHVTSEWIDIETGQVETQGVSKGLELAYKVKGHFAPEKSMALNRIVVSQNMASSDLEALRNEYEEKLRAKLSHEPL